MGWTQGRKEGDKGSKSGEDYRKENNGVGDEMDV